MTERNVIIELTHTKKLQDNVLSVMEGADRTLVAGAAPKLAAVNIDAAFPPVPVPDVSRREMPEGELYDELAMFTVDAEPEASTYIVRGTVEDSAIPGLLEEADKSKAVVGVYSDVSIEPMTVCPGSPPLGTDADVEGLLCTSRLHRCRLDGSGVLVAIVDTGFNTAYLNSKGKTPIFDAARSWSANPAGISPGNAPVSHGTMCAFDVCIAAPRCTLIDVPLLRPLSAPPGGTIMSGLLSDAILAYNHLLSIMTARRRPGDVRSLVVNNSWGMFHPSWDFPVGSPGNYSDNPNHPFNRIVVTLERAGADILFAAGNCGVDCPDSRCGGVTTRAIYGANSSPAVTCVAGVDTTRVRAGYSAIGPGRLADRKPDLCGYTHFRGSGVYAADGGTSAATPVVAGLVAAVRSGRPYDPADSATSPAAIRSLFTSTAEDLGPAGYDYQHGYGVVSGCELARRLRCPGTLPEVCRRYPWLCERFDICRRYPWICERQIWPPIPPIPPIVPPVPPITPPVPPIHETSQDRGTAADPILSLLVGSPEAEELSAEELAFLLGYLRGTEGKSATEAKTKSPCGCADNAG